MAAVAAATDRYARPGWKYGYGPCVRWAISTRACARRAKNELRRSEVIRLAARQPSASIQSDPYHQHGELDADGEHEGQRARMHNVARRVDNPSSGGSRPQRHGEEATQRVAKLADVAQRDPDVVDAMQARAS